MNRSSDIDLLLEECGSNIERVREKYKSAVTDERQVEVLKPLVKSTLEHLRSVLEYSAQDIWESYTKKKNKPYFPYGKNIDDFYKSLNKNLPGLKEQRPDLLSVVESIQPYVCGDDWLTELCAHTNFNKHNRLKPQVRKDSPSNTINIADGVFSIRESSGTIGKIWVNGILINANPMTFSNDTPQEALREMVDVRFGVEKRYDWVAFHFEGSADDVLAMLEKSQQGITLYISELNKLLC